MRLLLLSILLFFLSLSNASAAAEDYYQFKTQEDQQRFQSLTTELRCLVCQNQNIAESNASIAKDLRKQIYQQILQGHSEKQIIDYLVARYGNFILYKPPVNAATLGLWIGPFLFLFIGLGYLLYYLRNSARRPAACPRDPENSTPTPGSRDQVAGRRLNVKKMNNLEIS